MVIAKPVEGWSGHIEQLQPYLILFRDPSVQKMGSTSRQMGGSEENHG